MITLPASDTDKKPFDNNSLIQEYNIGDRSFRNKDEFINTMLSEID
jgi:hypothetical protein